MGGRGDTRPPVYFEVAGVVHHRACLHAVPSLPATFPRALPSQGTGHSTRVAVWHLRTCGHHSRELLIFATCMPCRLLDGIRVQLRPLPISITSLVKLLYCSMATGYLSMTLHSDQRLLSKLRPVGPSSQVEVYVQAPACLHDTCLSMSEHATLPAHECFSAREKTRRCSKEGPAAAGTDTATPDGNQETMIQGLTDLD